MECGGLPEELTHFREGEHTYHELEVLPGHRLILCNFCMVDFGSFDREFFGLPMSTNMGYGYMKLIRDVNDPSLGKDKFCRDCGYRLKFLEFVRAVRDDAAA
jgi:hypothetical protein